jgi:hypothetical protein
MGLRGGVFSANAADHEVENTTIMHERNVSADPVIQCKLSNLQHKHLIPGNAPLCKICMENEPKMLALCAARSHIVAVR